MQTMRSKRQKIAFITGTNSGIGKQLALEFHRRGVKVYATDFHFSESTLRSFHSKGILTEIVDVTKQEDIDRARDRVVKENNGYLDYLYNNAGIASVVNCVDQTSEEITRVYNVNFFGGIRVTKAFVEAIIKARGTIIFSGSVTEAIPLQGYSIYSSSKAALGQWASTLQVELIKFDVKVLNILGGYIDTNLYNEGSYGLKVPEDSVYNFPAYLEKLDDRQDVIDKTKPYRMSAKTFAKRAVDQIERANPTTFKLFEGGRAYRAYQIIQLASRRFTINHCLNTFGLNFDYREHHPELAEPKL